MLAHGQAGAAVLAGAASLDDAAQIGGRNGVQLEEMPRLGEAFARASG